MLIHKFANNYYKYFFQLFAETKVHVLMCSLTKSTHLSLF